MTRNRQLARLLVRLAMPVAAVLAVTAASDTAEAFRPQLGCTYGIYTEYYDEFGNVCAASDTCNNSSWGDCDDNLTFASYEEWQQVCYCDP